MVINWQNAINIDILVCLFLCVCESVFVCLCECVYASVPAVSFMKIYNALAQVCVCKYVGVCSNHMYLSNSINSFIYKLYLGLL